MIDLGTISHFFAESSLITYIVLIWLSFYLVASFAILFARLSYLAVFKANEKKALQFLLVDKLDITQSNSILKKCPPNDPIRLGVYKNLAERKASIGLTWLSIIASTSPFIGLFGTVISILETFGGLGTQNSLSIIAPKISEALVATGCGILVAIPAYTFHLILKRKAFELLSIIDSEIKILTKA